MHKNQISFCFIMASPVHSIEPLSKIIASVFHFFYEKLESYHIKGKLAWIKTFWTIQKSYPVISNINKLNKSKAAKSVSSFDFLVLYTKIPHDKLLCVLNEIRGIRDYVTFYNSGAFCSPWKRKTGRSYSLQEI